MQVFVHKREPKIFRFKDVMALRIRKCLTLVIPEMSSTFFGEKFLKPLSFRKD